MVCDKVRYKFFRNISEAEIKFSPGVNLLYGFNAEGKTNCLEGIYLTAQGRSHRTSSEKDFIKFGSELAEIQLDYRTNRRSESVSIKYLKNNRKVCKHNMVSLRKMSEFIGKFRAVIFCPEHLSIIKDGPAERRNFIDAAISQLDPMYVSSLQRYNAILLQRNKLISQYNDNRKAFNQTIELWSGQLAKEAAFISKKRLEYTEKLDKEVKKLFFEMTNERETPEIIYKKPLLEEQYLKLLFNCVEREIRAGTTLYGTHKDDLEITLNGRVARSFASQGQQRSLSLAMKLAEGEISMQESGEYPVFLFDDILSELDIKRQDYILKGISGRQVIITTCDFAAKDRIKSGKKYRVENGQFIEE